MTHQVSNIVPKLADGVHFYPFDSETSLVQQTEYGHQLRINNATYQLLKSVDGKRTVAEITKEHNQSFSSNLTIEKTYQLLYEYFSKWGIIQSDGIVQQRKKDGYLMLRITILPVAILRHIAPLFRFLFQPTVFWSGIAAMFFSTIFLLYFDKLYLQFPQKIDSQKIGYAYIFVAIGILLHEVGHIAACHRFGVNHGAIGFGFYLFMPVCFADVTDAWKLPSSKRIIIDFAGIFMDFILLYLCLIGFYFFEIDWLLLACGFILFNILFNVNPFFRFDGYWALTDALGIPNLRHKSMTYFLKIISLKIKLTYSRSSFFLFVYGAAIWFLLLLFLFSVVFYQASSLLYFPIEILKLFQMLIFKSNTLTINNLRDNVFKILIPLIFYITLWNLLKNRAISFKEFLIKTIQ